MATVPQTAGRSARATLATILAVGFALRVVAAFVVQRFAERIGTPCLFGDTAYYWELARTILDGEPFVVGQSGIPHFALRTPGYPLFLAACRTLFGPSFLAVRLVQAALGTLGILFIHQLVRRVAPRSDRPIWTPAMVAAAFAAVEPYGVGMGALILSEGAFIPLMLASLWGLAALWGKADGTARPVLIALTTGLLTGAAILVRPSWALIVPLLLWSWIIGAGVHRRSAIKYAAIIALSTAMIMMPWWVRNARVFGRFVPTAVWVGASLYDGLSPSADGGSDMRFLADPGIVELDESTQDVVLRRRSIDFATARPGRALRLAIDKAGRFWSPWPNAEMLRNPVVAPLSAIITLPLFALVAVGLWDRRRDGRALVLLAGPLFYFLALHMIFVSSIRYRIPGMFPALGLAAIGLERLRSLTSSRSVSA